MKKPVLILILLSQFSLSAWCKTNNDFKEEKKTASKILQKYATAKYITVDIEKEDEKLTLGTKTVSKGTIKYSAGKVYLILNSDKKTELYFKDGKLTLVDYPDQDFDKNGKRKVTVITKKMPVFLQSLVNLFSNPKIFFTDFKTTKSELKSNLLTLSLKANVESLKDFKLVLDVKHKTVEAISFVDDVSTMTSINFKDVNLKTKISKNTFDFKTIASDQVVSQ